eukprot:EC095576.1.p1 GENE.EC095576.1~~EC095576.1.p1  ORF type:complete len:151 (+),score=0.51 EC095576.1:2-454(+)
MIDSYADLLATYVEVENEEVVHFCKILFHDLLQLEQKMLEQEDEDGIDGGCEMCQRYTFLTKHHLIPKSTHKQMKKKGLSAEQLMQYAYICRQCHSAAHHYITNKEMAEYYNTIERIMENQHIQAFVKWNSKQKVLSRRRSNGRKIQPLD